jgi:hypothetical protein
MGAGVRFRFLFAGLRTFGCQSFSTGGVLMSVPRTVLAKSPPRALVALLLALIVSRPAAADVTLLFSPQDDIEKVWVDHIHAARSRIHIACFGLSNKAIAAALTEDPQTRHLEVIILEDHQQAQLAADKHRDLAAVGCHIIIKRAQVLLHDKLGVFADGAAIIGSSNLSQSAEAQDNSDAVFDGEPAQVAKVETAWERMFKREVRQDYAAGINLPPVFPEEGAAAAGASAPKKPQPASKTPRAAPTPAAAGLAWANTRSGKYFLPGSRYYGKTKEGAYMSDEEARAKGYVAAK